MNPIQQFGHDIHAQMSRVVIGQESNINMLLVSLLSGGHVLFEGPPGTGKTLLVNTFAQVVDLEFNRIQFTPDLMPGDVIGTNLFNFQTNTFTLTRGPIFTQLCLADEINRTPPKTQAALLQAMQERIVTLDGTLYPLSDHFMVAATQNPIESEGTYPLPEAQLDRFLFKLYVDYPTRDQEREMVKVHGQYSAMPDVTRFDLKRCASDELISSLKQQVREVLLSDSVIDYIVDLVRATREHSALIVGASPRAMNMIAIAARAHAGLEGRDFVIPDDVKRLIEPTLGHRVVLEPTAELDGVQTSDILRDIVQTVPAPR